jgi:transposase
MTTPGVGPVIALHYASAIDDPARFGSSKRAGAYFGLSQRKYQSGKTDITGRISRIGDVQVRACLYEAAHVMLTRGAKPSALKTWGQGLARRIGPRKAKVALARRLAVVLLRMLRDRAPFDPAKGAPAKPA